MRESNPDSDLTLSRALGEAGRNGAPGVLWDWWRDGRVDSRMLARVLAGVWSAAEYPERALPRRVWLVWFRQAAYRPPAEPLTLYRGAIPRYARGMAWTTDLDRAFWFSNRYGFDLQLDPGVMALGSPERQAIERQRFERAWERARETGERPAYTYAATVAPAGVLAVIDDVEPDGRGEGEVVVDPAYLPRPVRRWQP